jgi:hypothetical protein
MDNLAHKMVDTFEKMDAINPTFELIKQACVHLIEVIFQL